MGEQNNDRSDSRLRKMSLFFAPMRTEENFFPILAVKRRPGMAPRFVNPAAMIGAKAGACFALVSNTPWFFAS
jgi:hypothetical protein